MHIAIDLTSLAHNYSGIEQYAHRITRDLVHLGSSHRFTLLFEGRVYEGLAEESSQPHVRPLVIHPRHEHKFYVTQASVTNALKRVDADAFLFPAFPQPLTFLSPNAVSVIHDVSFWDCPETLTRSSCLYWRTSARHAAKQSLMVTVSEFSRRRICERLSVSSDRVAVVPNGIDRVFCIAGKSIRNDRVKELRRQYDLPDRYILSLCTLEPRKNLTQLIDAWILAREQQADAPDLVLAGRKGWKVDSLLSKMPDHLRQHIVLTGFVDATDLPSLYGLCDRFVCPSRYEGFGLPPLEALATGARVLCSDIDAFRETCDGLVTFFPLDDTESLAGLLSSAIPAPTLNQIDELCRRYDWQNSAKAMLQALERKGGQRGC